MLRSRRGITIKMKINNKNWKLTAAAHVTCCESGPHLGPGPTGKHLPPRAVAL